MQKYACGVMTGDATAAARALRTGGLAALPTETVYGLGALATDPDALARIYEVKGRPSDHPVIVHISGIGAASEWARMVPDSARLLAAAFWPGPLTLVLPRAALASDTITGGQETVALRAPAHPLFQEVLALLESDGLNAPGIAAPSANRFGRVSPTTASHVSEELGSRLIEGRDVILDGGPCAVGVESTIVIWSPESDTWQVAREGGVTAAQLAEIVPVSTASTEPSQRVPGALASHYSPAARVLLSSAESLSEVAAKGPVGLIADTAVATPPGWQRLCSPGDPEAYARDLYAALRSADADGIATVVAVPPPGPGLAAAVRDRLTRAAR